MAEDKNEALTPEEIRVQEIFDEYDPPIGEYNKRLEAITFSKPKPELRPPWADPNRFGEKTETKEFLKKEIDRLKTEARTKATVIWENSSPSVQAKLDDKIERWQNPDFKEAHEKKTMEQTEASLLRAGRMNDYKKEAISEKENLQPASPEVTEKADIQPELPQSNYAMRLRFNNMEVPPVVTEPDKSDIEPTIDPGEE